MCITEYDEARTFAEQREEGKKEGKKEGKEEGIEEGIEIGGLRMLIGLVKKGVLTLAQAAEEAHMTIAEFEAKAGLKA